MTRVVAIDGPSGAGKGTVARAVARALGWRHIDTGAMYRAVAWRVQQLGGDLDDETAVASVARTADVLVEGDRVQIGADDITADIRTPAMDAAASRVGQLAAVRAALVARQRMFATAGPLVMEGRDIGTVVFPDAAVKIFLDAAPAERARRRAADSAHAAARFGRVDIAAALAARDRRDSTRSASPLTRAPDAVLIDTTGMAAAAVVDRVLAIVRERIASGVGAC